MLTLSVERLIEVVGGVLLCGEPESMVNGLVTDSRHVEPGVLFVALPGERVDGHDYIDVAISHGARAALISRPPEEDSSMIEAYGQRGVAIVRVADCLHAVQQLAAYHRSRLFCPVIGVTGSTGKTTTKEFIAAVLSSRTKVVATEGNQNNELGVPLTLLRAGADTDVLVVEMAMRGRDQITRLCEIARPTAGIVTNVGTAHIELLGSQDSIAAAKGELVQAIPPDGAVFLNGDDEYSGVLANYARAPVSKYGLDESCDVVAREIVLDGESRAHFDLCVRGECRRVALAIPGRHNVYNALAAAAIASYLEVSVDQIVDGLSEARAGDMRMQSFQSATGVHVINDAYNANPASMRAAIETLAGIETTGKRVAVLGDMAELGSLSELAHFRIGEEVARLPIQDLITVGERAIRIADGARAEGMEDESIWPCASVDEALDVLEKRLVPGDVMLVKASRVIGLEALVDGIVSPRV